MTKENSDFEKEKLKIIVEFTPEELEALVSHMRSPKEKDALYRAEDKAFDAFFDYKIEKEKKSFIEMEGEKK